MEYKSQDIQRTFDVSAETVRTWANEFEQYLSPTANPGTGRHRIFTEADLTVFALISETKDRGGTYEDAHVSLKTGQRGLIPTIADERGLTLQVKNQLAIAQMQIEQITSERDEAKAQVKDLESEIIRLSTRLDESEKRIAELKDSQSGRDDLLMELGKLKALLEIERAKNSE